MADNITRKARRQPIAELKKQFGDFNINPDDLKEVYRETKTVKIEKKLNENPSFPMIMFNFALIVDILDFADLTILGTIISFILQVAFIIIGVFWFRGKMKGKIWKKVLIKIIIRKIIIWVIVIGGFEMIPVASVFIPGNVIMVLMAHNANNKAVIALNKLLEIIHEREIEDVKKLLARG
jgi:hypothetical protein